VDELAQIVVLLLAVIDLIPDVLIAILEDVEDREQLTIVGHKGLANHLPGESQRLDQGEGAAHDSSVATVESGLERNDELGDDGQDLGAALF